MIIVPNYSPGELNYITEVILYINGIQRESSPHPIIPAYDGAHKRTYKGMKAKMEYIKFYSKFLYKTGRATIRQIRGCRKVNVECVRDDPLDCLKHIRRTNRKLKLNRFIEPRADTFCPNELPFECDELLIVVKYKKIREEIVSYIEQKIGRTKELEELKELFSCDNTLSFDEFINRKSKFLTEINLDDYVSSLNEQTELKRGGRK